MTVPSPFLPGTFIQTAWDSTSLSLLKRCPRLYQYKMIDGWAEKNESIHLFFGSEYHHALETFDRAKATGAGFEAAMRVAVASCLERTRDWEVDETEKPGKYKNRASLLRTVVWYLDNFREDPAQTFILANGKPAVELSFKFELDFGPHITLQPHTTEYEDMDGVTSSTSYKQGHPYVLCGHLDRVVVLNEGLFDMDRKTTTYALTNYYFNQFDPDNQVSLYTLASQVILDSPIKGVIIDAAQLLVHESRFGRHFTTRSADRIEEWITDLRIWLRMAEIYAKTEYWPQNDTACDKYGGCPFREVCSASPRLRETYLNADFVQLPEEERWNPLKPR